MKRLFSILSVALAATMLFSCAKEENKPTPTEFDVLNVFKILTVLQVPQALMSLVTEGDFNRWIVLIGINIVLLLLGCVLETVSIILITLPMLYPIIKALGFDPIWFNVVMLINMELALITPPVGMNLFVIKGISEDSSIQDIIAGSAPFALIMVFEIALLCFVPEIATWLPSVLK